MLYTSQALGSGPASDEGSQEGGARGKFYDPKKEKFEEAMRKLKKDEGIEYLTPFFTQAEHELRDNKTNAVDKRVKLLKDKVVEIMRSRLGPEMGEENVEQLVSKVTQVQIKECFTQARERREEAEYKKKKAEDAEKKKKEEAEKAEEARKSEETKKKEEERKAKEWESMDKNDVIEIAFNTTRGSLAATLKRAQLLRKGIKMEDVKRWRLEHQNKEKKTDRKNYNSWVGNKKKDEYQVDLFYFMDLKKKQAIEELSQESDSRINQEEAEAIGGPHAAAEDIARNFDVDVAVAAQPKAKAKAQPKAKARSKRQEILQRIRELTWEYENGLLAVDTFSKIVAVVPMKNRDWSTIRTALERVFQQMGGKPASIYSDAEAALTSDAAKAYFREKDIVHNITLGHAPVAERMIGVIKADIVHYLRNRSEGKKWWDVVGSVVKEYNEEHVSRSTKMTPIEAAKDSNRDVVKTNLEAARKMDNPQDRIHVGDQVRVMKKKVFDKSYVPNWTEKLFKVIRMKEWDHPDLPWQLHPHDPQVKYQLGGSRQKLATVQG